MKKFLLLISFLSVSIYCKSQTVLNTSASATVYNKYLIKIDTNIVYNVQNTRDYLKTICAANSATYKASTKYYEILTKKKLEYNIISGKLQKNATPMADFILVGKIDISLSEETTTINAQ